MCDKPKHAFWKKDGTGITFDYPEGFHPLFSRKKADLLIPCKRCIGCRLEHRKMWSIRMMHEASLHESNQFVTLTYDPENLPKKGDLDQTDMQKFFKRLRKEFAPEKLRYVYSGEYGAKHSRPHYHAIIFGLKPTDLYRKGTNERGEGLYGSHQLDRLWTHGQTTTGEVTHQSCGYVAGYMLKDSTGEYGTDEHGKPKPYHTINIDTGELTERTRPFARYSSRPGIGKGWFDKYHSDLFPGDTCVIRTAEGDIVETAVPPYYLRQLEKLNPDLFDQIKLKREAAIETEKALWNNTPARKRVRAQCRDAKIKAKSRGSKTAEPNLTYYTNEALENVETT